ncbi:UBA-like_superfamily [Hexamita inflata]|uniref:UBA-like superfamily n=1 Tax=Hexamita inflata TaxID=28002 RepID=A0AA86QWA9_9EUKA|nr:UBA-like superfamily [Hexamita inflata]
MTYAYQFQQKTNFETFNDRCAYRYLVKTKYDVDKAVNNFYNDIKQFMELTSANKSTAIFQIEQANDLDDAIDEYLSKSDLSNKNLNNNLKADTYAQKLETIKSFMGYTNKDMDFAQQYLMQHDFDITKALNQFKIDQNKLNQEKQILEKTKYQNSQNSQDYTYQNRVTIELQQYNVDNNQARQPEKQYNYQENIKAFMGYTNASQEIAQQYLNSTNNNITNALKMYKTDQENVLKLNQERNRLNIKQKVNQEDSQQYSNNTNGNLNNQAPYNQNQTNQKQFQNSQHQTTTNDDLETNKHKSVRKEPQDQQQSTPPPPERQISPNKQNQKTGFFGPKKEEEIASFQEKYLCEPKNANKVQTVSFAVRNGTQLVQFIQNKNPKLILKHQIEQLNEIQESVQIQMNEAEKQELNQIVQQYLIGQFQNAQGTEAQNQQKVQQGYQQNVANAYQQQPQQQQNIVNFQSQQPQNQFNQYGYNQFTKYQQQGPLQAVIAPVQQFNLNQNVTNVPLQARPMTPQGQNPIMQQQIPQYAENLGQSIQQRPVSRGQPNYAQDNQFVQTLPQAPVFNQGRPMSPVNLQFVQNPVLQNNVNRPMTPQSQASYQLMQQQPIQNYQQNYNQFQQQNPAAFPQNRPLTPSYYANPNNQINQAQQQAQFQPQYQQNNAQTFQQPQVLQNQVTQQIPNSNQMNQNQIPANMDISQQIVQHAQMQTAPFQQSAEQQKVIQQALFQQQFQNSDVPVLQLSGKNE